MVREHPAEFDRGLARRGLPPRADEVLALDRHGAPLRPAPGSAGQAQPALARDRLPPRLRSPAESSTTICCGRGSAEESRATRRRRKAAATARCKSIRSAGGTAQSPGRRRAGRRRTRPPIASCAASASRRVSISRPCRTRRSASDSGMMDFARAAKLSGSRFVVLSGALARLERALGAIHARPAHPRVRLQRGLAAASGARRGGVRHRRNCRNSPRICSAPTNGYWLIPTAEVPLTNLVAGEILDEAALPLRFTAWTPCFRSEAGAAGKDTRGMIRQHQFKKVELVSVTRPERFAGRARAHDPLRRGGAEAARARLSRRAAVDRRHGLRRAKDLRHRGLAAGAGQPIARFRAARIAAPSRRGECRRAIVRPRGAARCRCTR